MSEDNLIEERKKKLKAIIDMGINPYPYSYDQSHHAAELNKKYESLAKEETTNDNVSVAGRIMSIRNMGKAAFFDIKDWTGRIQAYVRKDDLGEKQFNLFMNLDISDWVGVKGNIFKTKLGQVSVNCRSIAILGKTLRPLPEKFHGIKDKEIRYRKRYLDLITNDDVMELFRKRAQIINCVRNYLNNLNFLELETPILQVLYGGTNAKPFKTHINAYDMEMYLRIAPELYLKRAVIGGFERVYEIARNFRNEGVDLTHNPEFSMVEWYEMYADYNLMMDRAEELLRYIAREVFGKEEITVHGKKVDLSKKWPRITLKDALKKFADIDIDEINDKELEELCNKNGADVNQGSSRGHLVFALFDKIASQQLFEPTWIIDYPKEVSPLAKTHRYNPELVERFEGYIGGKELCDGWSEIIDGETQRKRFNEEQAAMRAGINKEAHPVDEDFIIAMEHGMPCLGGIGMGIDRLVMVMTDNWSIKDVILFPIMKPENKND